MTVLGVILIAIGGGDALRVLTPHRWTVPARILLLGIFCLTVLAAATAAAVIPWWQAVMATPGILVWFVTVQIGPALVPTHQLLASPRRRAAMIILFLLLTSLAVLSAELTTGSIFTSVPLIGRLTEETLVLATGLTLFLAVSSNALVRAALKRETAPLGEIPAAPGPQLKGGRWIGPLERLTLAWLLIIGAYPAAAGLFAAKGIVRFPEIQADQEHGNRAEYFLVGSFVSWALAIGAAGLLRLTLLG